MKKIILFLSLIVTATIAYCDVTALFNGKNLDDWNFYLSDSSVDAKKIFFAKDGAINIVGKPFGYMYTKKIYGNFRISFEWRYPKEASNSGFFLFVQDEHKLWVNAIEVQLCSGKAGDFVLLGGSDLAEFKCDGERPKFPVVKRSVDNIENPIGQWNKGEVICKDGNIEVYINSVKVNQGSKPMFKTGHIALQSEGGLIQFRNIILEDNK